MKRTTVVLPDDLAALIDRERRRRGVSTAGIIREALDAYFTPDVQPLPFVALGGSGHRDTAERMEELLDQAWTLDEMKGTDTGQASDQGAS